MEVQQLNNERGSSIQGWGSKDWITARALGKAGLPYEYEHDEKSTVEQQPQHQNQKLSAVGRSSIYSINKLGLPQKSLLNYLWYQYSLCSEYRYQWNTTLLSVQFG